MSAICLKRHCPFILEPKSSFDNFLKHLILLIIVLQVVWIPYMFSFERTLGPSSFSLLFLFDLFYFLDIYLQLSTAIKHKRHTNATALQIAVEKMKNVWFLVDVSATIPLDYYAYIISCEERLIVLFKLNRLLKAYRLLTFMSKKENEIIVNIVGIKLLKYLLIYVIICKLFEQ